MMTRLESDGIKGKGPREDRWREIGRGGMWLFLVSHIPRYGSCLASFSVLGVSTLPNKDQII